MCTDHVILSSTVLPKAVLWSACKKAQQTAGPRATSVLCISCGRTCRGLETPPPAPFAPSGALLTASSAAAVAADCDASGPPLLPLLLPLPLLSSAAWMLSMYVLYVSFMPCSTSADLSSPTWSPVAGRPHQPGLLWHRLCTIAHLRESHIRYVIGNCHSWCHSQTEQCAMWPSERTLNHALAAVQGLPTFVAFSWMRPPMPRTCHPISGFMNFGLKRVWLS